MRTSIFAGAQCRTIDEMVDCARDAADARIGTIWFPQINMLDTLTALAATAREVRGITFGTAVIPIQGRHPINLAQQALTVAEAAGAGRFKLGIGVSHPHVSEGWYGMPYKGIVSHFAQALPPLASLLADRRADWVSEQITARVELPASGPGCDLLVAAMGPRMLNLAGRHADGTVTWMTGLNALRTVTIPTIRQAAAAAGRGPPDIIVGLPLCVTDDPARLRAALSPMLERLVTYPAYQRQFINEQVAHPIDIALLGDEAHVRARLAAFAEAGATEFLAIIPEQANANERTRSLQLLADIGGRSIDKGGQD